MTRTLQRSTATIFAGVALFATACGQTSPQTSESVPQAVEHAAGARVGAHGTTVAATGTDWFNETSGGAGASVAAAYAQHAVPAGAPIIVAVIDSGVDINHEDLQGHIWTNTAEIPGDGIDNDHNGYIDDVHGWNFLVDKNGADIGGETLELTREFARYYKPYLASRNNSGPALSSTDYNRLVQLYNEFVPKYRAAPAGSDEAKYHYNWQLEQRGDDLTNFASPGYGNDSLIGPDARHGTHVAGIIAAVRGNGKGIDGIASNVKIMVLRAVPNGDEMDKDVAHAVRYAADNGARVVNMSFGKSLSRFPAQVLDAMDYAAGKGVLFVHAAGNDNANTDTAANFPNRKVATARLVAQWLEIGASTDAVGLELPAKFSNFGATAVDVFAPGFEIRSSIPGNAYESLSGTSMASPVVAGIAALALSHSPTLTAAQVKTLIMDAANRYGTTRVYRPGTRTRVNFSTLSRTGAVVDAARTVARLYAP